MWSPTEGAEGDGSGAESLQEGFSEEVAWELELEGWVEYMRGLGIIGRE